MRLGNRKFATLKELVAFVAPGLRPPKTPWEVLTPKQRARHKRFLKQVLKGAGRKTVSRGN